MAIKRKTDLKQTYRSKPRRTPPTAPIDLVRNPNFDSAMAEANYRNSMAEQRARMETERRQLVDGMLTSVTNSGNPGGQQSTNSTAGYVQVDPNTNAPSLMPIEIGGSMSGGTGDPRFIYNNLPYISQVGSVPVRNTTGIGGQQFGQIAQGIGRLMPQMPQFPQGQQQQMQNYQNFLQQGMQNSNTMNQGAMNNFANIQPGMQATQTASTATPNQTMPVAGMGSQKPKAIQLPRTFSTRNNQSARFA